MSSIVNDLNLNPFKLSTASSVWEDPSIHSLTKPFHLIKAAAFDVFIKNPYKLTIDNSRILKNSWDTQSTTSKACALAVITLGILYTTMLYGASLHMQGRCLLALTKASESLILVKIGTIIKKIGTYIFITGAVPIYGLFYAIPKKIVTSLPQIAQFTLTKIQSLANGIFKYILQPLWNNLFIPIIQAITKTYQMITSTLNTVIHAIAKTTASLANGLFKYILQPLWNNLFIPIIQAITKTYQMITSTLNAVIHAIAKTTASLANGLFKYILQPLWNNLFIPIIQGVAKTCQIITSSLNAALHTIAKTIASLANGLFKYILQPLLEKILFPLITLTQRCVCFAANIVCQSMKALSLATQKIASLIFSKVIMPIASLLYATAAFLYRYTIAPTATIISIMIKKITNVASIIFNHFLLPIGQCTTNAALAIKNQIVALHQDIWHSITEVWNHLSLYFNPVQ